MEKPPKTVRNAIRAVIIKQGHVLLQQKQDPIKGLRYALPGGAQEAGESILQALQRECQEELGTEVIIGEILHLAEYYKEKLLPAPHTQQQLEILFSCQVSSTYIPQNGPKPDKHQIAVQWVALDSLADKNLQPAFLVATLTQLAEQAKPIYLGTFN